MADGGNGVGKCDHRDPIVQELEAVMRDQGLTFQQVAKRSGVDRTAVQKWCRLDNPQSPRLSSLRAVLQAVGMDVGTTGQQQTGADHE